MKNTGKTRMTPSQYFLACRTQLRRYWKHIVIPSLAVGILSIFFRVDVNYTESLPGLIYLTVKGCPLDIHRGDYVVYRFPTEHPYSPFRKGAHMLKLVGGVEGDEVRMETGGAFWIIRPGDDDKHHVLGSGDMGIAKPYSKSGKPLKPGPVGIIPKGAYYVYTPHPDSLDSRYAMVGWIRRSDIIGRAYRVF